MEAVMKVDPEAGIVIKEIEEPTPGPEEVLIEVKSTAICGSDLHLYYWDDQARRWKAPLPKVIGHEFSGEVLKIGDRVRTVKVGDRIAGESHIPCQKCYLCRTGRMHICKDMLIYGIHTTAGSFNRYAVLPEVIAYQIPDEVSYEEGALFEPFGVAVHSVERAQVNAGDVAVVFGCGPIGLYAQQIATAAGATVVGIDVKDVRLNYAQKIGCAKYTVNPSKEDVLAKVMEITDNRGADVVFELAGSPTTIKQSFDILRKNGRVALVGISEKPVEIETTNSIIYKEATVFGSTGRLMFETWDRMSKLVKDRRVDLASVVSHKLPLIKADEGFQAIIRGEAVKVLLTP